MGDVAVRPATHAVVQPSSSHGRRARGLRRLVPEGVVAVVAALVYVWGVATPGPWRDEAATLVVCRRPVSAIVAMAHDLDLVHLAYYLVAHVVLSLQGGLASIRLISVAAMAATAVLLVRIGRRLGGWHMGVLAAAVLVASPMGSRYAQEARPTAIVTLAVTAATLLLLGALAATRRGPWVAYAVAVVIMALFSVLALIVLPAHAIVVLAARRRDAALAWAGAVGAAVAVLAPFVVAVSRQQGQIWWLWRPSRSELAQFFGDQMGARWVLGAAVAVTVIAGVAMRKLERGAVLAVAWALMPPLLLWSVSQVHTYWQPRYLVPALPGTALAVAWAMTSLVGVGRRLPGRAARVLPRLTTAAVVLTVVWLVWPHQQELRRPLGHGEDLTAAAAYLQRVAEPGDAVVYLPGELRLVAVFAPRPSRLPQDALLDTRAVHPTSIGGAELSPAAVAPRLAAFDRIWVVHSGDLVDRRPTSADPAVLTTLATLFRTDSRRPGNVDVDLYERL